MSRALYEIAGRTALITGAARGIGAETARRLHSAGANVALLGIEPERLDALAAELGERALWREVDVTDADAVRAAVADVVEEFGGIDIAVANAGVHWTGPMATTPLETLEREIEINLFGVVRTVHAVLPHVIERRGYILNIASLAAASHAPLMTSYAASKAGVEALTNSLRTELAGTGARAGCAYFGIIETDMVRSAFGNRTVQAVLPVLPGFARRPAPLSSAIDAIEDGIRRRRARVWAPRYVGPALLARGILQPLTELRVMRSRKLAGVIAAADPGVERSSAEPAPQREPATR
ncbi:MAG TPA: short-chain dehydrogenase/reductase [Solirubrobacterales bacterium]|nr:short-chain dehydrogenase/reductase [Solirubrobacterales bacterium]